MRKSTFQDLTGKRFGRVTVIDFAGRKGRRITWNCLCDCGEKRVIVGDDLRSGHTASCGCLASDINSLEKRTHGMSRTPTHRCWTGMRNRCNNPKTPKFRIYGARGIKVDPRWDSFENFLADMGEKPTPKHSIERKYNNGNYEPGNCIWGTAKDQARNQRRTKYCREDAERVRRMRKEGWKWREIAEHFNTSIGCVATLGRGWVEE